MALYQLIYQSIATSELEDRTLFNLLARARQYNIECGVTGILLYGSGMFTQLLEGEDDIVRALFYSKIAIDSRHRQCRVLKEGIEQKRLFKNWSMAFRRMDPTLFVQVAGYIDPEYSPEFARVLLHPLETMEGFKALATDVQQNGE